MITITDLAARHGLTLRALRFYEQKGLISPQRSGRTRLYSEEDAQKLAVILDAAALGFTLTEIHGMVVKGPRATAWRSRLRRHASSWRSCTRA
jgi:DNA-binding transcriptional MerR regulator